MASNTHVAPQTLSRLELLLALPLTGLIDSVIHALKSKLQLFKSRCFSDSTVAHTMLWIQGGGKIVQNRVLEVQKPECWTHFFGRDRYTLEGSHITAVG
jgi:hypothetical protein